jgi:hypothetical protein
MMITVSPAWKVTISDDIALAAGRFIAAPSLMDHALQEIIWHLLGNDHEDLRPLTWNLSVGARRDIITDLLSRRQIEPAQLDAWEKAKPLLKEVSEARNWVAHGFWWNFPAGYIRTHKGTVGTLKTVKVEDLERWTDTARNAIALVTRLLPP